MEVLRTEPVVLKITQIMRNSGEQSELKDLPFDLL